MHTHAVHLLRRSAVLAVVENMRVERLLSGARNVWIVGVVCLVMLRQHSSTHTVALLLELTRRSRKLAWIHTTMLQMSEVQAAWLLGCVRQSKNARRVCPRRNRILVAVLFVALVGRRVEHLVIQNVITAASTSQSRLFNLCL